jgi:hypothetical protein
MTDEERRSLAQVFRRFRARRPVSVVVFSQANLNAIDGSSVWVQTVISALAGVRQVEVSILLSHELTTDRIAGPLLANPGVTVIDPFGAQNQVAGARSLSLDEAAEILVRRARKIDVLIVRGAEAAGRLAGEPKLQGKLWPYLTDVPQRAEDIDDGWRDKLEHIMKASPILLCQTEELRSFLESSFDSVAGKGRILPPIVPDDVRPEYLPAPTREDLRLCYSGKFARHWNTYEMCELPAQLADRGIQATLTMVGDKINQDPDWAEYVSLMRDRLESSPGVDWVRGVSRAESIAYMARAHLGFSWRSRELDDSLELSTKLLEYCAAGTPPLLNRTAMHERVFGVDYPLFVSTADEVVSAVERLTTEAGLYERVLQHTGHIPQEHTLTKATQRLTALLEETTS